MFAWTPEVFWRSTPWEFWAAFDGHLELIRARNPGAANDPITPDEMEELMEMFPDN